MWLVWNSPLRLHLGRGLAFLQLGRGETQIVKFPATLPLIRQLATIDEGLKHLGNKVPHPRGLEVTLSAALAPAFSFPIPANVKRWEERRKIAQGVAASRVGASLEECLCDFDSEHPGIAASVPVGLYATIQAWAVEHSLKLSSMAPLWAVATQCRRIANRRVRSMVIYEPDAVTVAYHAPNGLTDGASWPSEGDIAAGRTQAAAWLSERGAESRNTAHLAFVAEPTRVDKMCPEVFQAYWNAA